MMEQSTQSASTAGTETASRGSTSTENTQTTPTASAASPTPEAKSTTPAVTDGAPPVQADGTPAPVVPAFTPNYKYKAFQKEKELEEFWHPLIKDPESEKKVKDLFTRAEAFDDLKARFEGTTQEFSKIYNEYQELDTDVRRVTSFLNKGDLDNFFSSVGLDDRKVFEWVAQKLEQENLPPEQKRALQTQQQERQRLYDLEMEKTTLEQQYQNQAAQARAMQLDTILSRSEVSQAASAWDNRMGQLGAFRDLVIEEAQKAWYSQGKDLTVEQAVQGVLTKYGKLLDSGNGNSAQPAQGVPASTVQAQSQPATSKPVIPAVQGRGTSPVKKSPKSLDELRAMARESSAG